MKKIIFILVFLIVISTAFSITEENMRETNIGIGDSKGENASNPNNQGAEKPNIYTNQETYQGEKGMDAKQSMVQTGEFQLGEGQKIRIQKQENNQYRFESKGVNATSSMEFAQEENQEQTRLYAKLSNGKNAEIKIMPDVAAQRAMEQLKLKNCGEGCQIELKQVGNGEQIRAAYEIKTQRQSKVFGLFKAQMKVQAQVDAENGEIIQLNKPWWAFIASEPEE